MKRPNLETLLERRRLREAQAQKAMADRRCEEQQSEHLKHAAEAQWQAACGQHQQERQSLYQSMQGKRLTAVWLRAASERIADGVRRVADVKGTLDQAVATFSAAADATNAARLTYLDRRHAVERLDRLQQRMRVGEAKAADIRNEIEQEETSLILRLARHRDHA